MNDWLDDLSEDWPSQPPSLNASQYTKQLGSSMSNIPRVTLLSGPISQPGGTMKNLRISANGSQRSNKAVLTERSPSQENMAQLGTMERGVKSNKKSTLRRSTSAESAQSAVMYATVEKKALTPSPIKTKATDETPEWKRRLLMGERGYGDQTDLFGPSGIECIFQKPPPQEGPKDKPRGLSFLKGLETIPSSPPWPQAGSQSFLSMDQNLEDPFGGLAPVAEAEEQQPSPNRQSQQPFEDIISHDGGQNDDNDVFSDGPSSLGSNLNHADMRAKHSAAFASTLSKRSRQSSAQSAQSNGDSFSAVFIGKHATADGGIAYAPIDLSRSELAEQLARMGMSNASQNVQRKPSGVQSRVSTESPVKSDDLPDHLLAGTPEIASIGEFVTTKRGGYSDDGSFLRRPLSPSPEKPSMVEPIDEASYDEDGFLKEKYSQSRQPSQQTSNSSEATTAIHRIPNGIDSRTICGPKDLNQRNNASTPQRTVSTASRFGEGELDDHGFPEDEFSSLLEYIDDNNLPTRSPSPDVMPPGYQQQFKFRVESASDLGEHDTYRGKRKLSKVSAKSTISVTKRNSAKRGMKSPLNEQQPEIHYAEGKRPPPSPFKNPTPKRRRTFLEPDLQEEEQNPQLNALRASHERVQSAIGKRKDARHGSFMLRANPDILAGRQILRPRNPTPSQRRHELVEVQVEKASEISFESPPRLDLIQKHLAAPVSSNASTDAVQAHMVANEMVAFSQRVSHGMHDDSRKRSVTTQDFLDEAMKIMSFIRNKGRPGSDLGNLQESHLEGVEEEKDQNEMLGISTGPSEFSVSRPPSREDGRGGWRSRIPHERSPSVMNYLKRFQEEEDDSFMGASVGSKFGQHVQRVVSRADNHIETIESDPPGIHIIGGLSHHRGDSNSNTEPRSSRSNATAKSTHSSQTSASTLGQTTASRKSETVATLAPEAVAHLIPEEVAGMSFDKDRGIWVKNKSPRKESQSTRAEDIEISDVPTSEGDPFGNIPDLTYDEEEEERRLRRQHALMLDRSALNEQLLRKHRELDMSSSRESVMKRSQAESASLEPVNSHNDNAPQHVQTEALQQPLRRNDVPADKPGTSHSAESVEHEIKIDEGRDHRERPPTARKFTVSIPASLASSVQNAGLQVDRRDFVDQPSTPLQPEPQSHRLSHRPLPQPPRMTVTAPSVSTVKSSPLPVVDENHELSFLSTAPSRRHVNFSLSLSRAYPPPRTGAIDHSSPFPGSDITFYMSELSEFSVHQTDERQLRTRPNIKRHQELEDRFAWGNHLLVKALQDNEANEPHWEDLRSIDLNSKGITSLHLLDELCDRLEKADLSCNQIEQLSGAPSSLRCLDLHQNKLSGLTFWGHLTNLQYLDVSNNKIDSLTGFNTLVHMRELKADNNCITHLDGLYELDGLLKVSVRNNNIKGELDFGGFQLNRLESLDLGGNQITSVSNLHWLPALQELIVDGNKLSRFPHHAAEACPQLEYLDISSNTLTSISMESLFSALKELVLDRNSLSGSAIDLGSIHHLDILSLRAQSLPSDISFSLPAQLPSITTLNLSLNPLHAFPTLPSSPLLTLRSLELASCGLTTLPTHFGLSAPNLRVLNLNLNAIRDLRPLLNIPRLSTLLVSCNRLNRLRKTMAVLAKLDHLDTVDLRDNPFSLGFYALPTTGTSTLISSGALVSTATAEPSPKPPNLPLSLPWHAHKDDDVAYVRRLDADTALRRRVYEMMLASACGRMAWLDGLPFVRKEVLVKDGVWERLVALGILRKK